MRKFLAILALLVAPVAFAQTGEVITGSVINQAGTPIAGALITVCAYPGSGGSPCTNLVTLYGNPALSVQIANPTTSDALGNYSYWVPPNNYQEDITGPFVQLHTRYQTTAQTNTVTISPSVFNNVVFVNGSPYATTAAGINAADASCAGRPCMIVDNFPSDVSDTTITVGEQHDLEFCGAFTVLQIQLPDSTTDNTGAGTLGGCGRPLTILTQKSGANRAMVTTSNFASLKGGTNFYGVVNSRIHDLILDGNHAGNTSGDGVDLFGRKFSLNNVTVQNTAGDGLYTGGFENGASTNGIWDPQVTIYGLSIYNAGAVGWEDYGPNDIYTSGTVIGNSGLWNFIDGAPIHFNSFNTYGGDQNTPNSTGCIETVSGLNGEAGAMTGDDLQATCATGWGYLGASPAGSWITNGSFQIFNGTTPSTRYALELRGSNDIITGSYFSNNGLTGGHLINIAGSIGSRVEGLIGYNAKGPYLTFTSELGPNTFNLVANGSPAGPTVWYTGTPPGSNDTVSLNSLPGSAGSGFYQFPGLVTTAQLNSISAYNTLTSSYNGVADYFSNNAGSDDTVYGIAHSIISAGLHSPNIGLAIFATNPGTNSFEQGVNVVNYHNIGVYIQNGDAASTNDFGITVPSDTGIAITVNSLTGGAHQLFGLDRVGNLFTYGNADIRGQLQQVVGGTWAGACTLGTNCTITFTHAYSTVPVCIGTDQTAANAVKTAPTMSSVTFTGTGTDIIDWACFGNPN